MPSILTHQYFANQIIQQFKNKLTFLESNQALVWVGSQGPDPFFFYGNAPFKRRLSRTTINQFGSTLHNQKPEQSLWPLIQKGFLGSHADDITKAYVIGALTHYALDRTCHPYVFFRSGFDEHGSLSGHYNADHARLEMEMDIGLVQKLKLSSQVYQPKHTLVVDPVSLQSISQLYFTCFPKQVSHHTYQDAVNDMRATYRFLYHGSMFNRLLVVIIAGRRSLPMSLIHPTNLKSVVTEQALNVTRKTWKHPITGKAQTDTVLQLIQQAQTYLEKLIASLIKGTLTETELIAWCDEVDYDGKKFGKTMRYFSSYYPSYRGKPHQQDVRHNPTKKSV